MHPVHRLSIAELTAAHLRGELRQGRWEGKLPGVVRLAAELDVSRDTIRDAMRLLETEGLLNRRGPGRSRTITWRGAAHRRLRVGILLPETPLHLQPQPSQVVLRLEHDLEASGHVVFFARHSQAEVRTDVLRVARHISQYRADVWVVVAGSRELLAWFAAQDVPCLALYGRTEGLQLARTGPDKVSAYIAATRQLLALGHRRIVLIASGPRRKPPPGNLERAFLDELAAHGVNTGKYNLPDWEETPEAFCGLLENLFRVTPPTGLIIEETPRVIAAMQFLARHRISVPEQVSLVSTDYDRSLEWCRPAVAHMSWNNDPIVLRIVRWVTAVKRGAADRKTINFTAKFISGGSVGPAPKIGLLTG